MKTDKREAASQDRWEKFKRQRRVGGVWLELDENGFPSCRDAIGRGDDASNGLMFNVKDIWSEQDLFGDGLKAALQKSDRVALLVKGRRRKVSDIGEVLVQFIKRRGDVPEEGIACGTIMLVPGRLRHAESIDDWYVRTIPLAERWAAGNPTSLHKHEFIKYNEVVAETERTNKGVQNPDNDLTRAELPTRGAGVLVDAPLFAGTAALIDEAREQFGRELMEAAGLSLKDAESGHVVSQIIQMCEETSSVLRTPQGDVVTLKFNAGKNETSISSLSASAAPGTKRDTTLERLPEFVPVPISSLSLREAAAATAIINGMRRAAIMTAAQRGRGGRKAAENTSPEQRKANASKAAKVLSESMTPEERSERARKAGVARQMKARAERESRGMNSEGS